MRPRWGRNFWKSVRCCVQLVFVSLCFLQLVVYREFSMDTMQMVVAIPLCFGSFVHHLWLAHGKIHTNTDEYWVDVITSAYRERPA